MIVDFKLIYLWFLKNTHEQHVLMRFFLYLFAFVYDVNLLSVVKPMCNPVFVAYSFTAVSQMNLTFFKSSWLI